MRKPPTLQQGGRRALQVWKDSTPGASRARRRARQSHIETWLVTPTAAAVPVPVWGVLVSVSERAHFG